MTQARWRVPQTDFAKAEALAVALGIRLPAARVLLARGYTAAQEARSFLSPSFEDLHDPFLMLGMREALERLREACGRREKILLYGDYDVDGTISVAILKKAIELAGGEADFYIPHRVREGYGMRPEVIETAAADGVQLIVSLDTGIRAAAAVRHARELGIDVIVTDHHVPDNEIPPACAVLNPRQPGCAYPHKDLCGAGVALKLVQALLGSLNWPADRLRRTVESFVRPVAIATIADVVPLTGENRALVKFGLEGLRSARSPGLKALLSTAGFADGDAPSAGQVAFRIAPRLNAAGRMADAREIVTLLLTRDEEEARRLAGKLDELNRERQGAEDEIVRAILAACLDRPVGDADYALVFSGEGWHRGVIGIVANRIVERFHRPVIVLSEDPDEGVAHGSGRSIAGFDLLSALESMCDLFLRFGGHRQAAGLALPCGRIGEFRERFNAYAAARLTPEDLQPEIEIDARLDFSEICEASIADVLSLAPFGCGNPAPVFGVQAAEVLGEPSLLKDRHLRLNLRQGGRTLMLKAWNSADRIHDLVPGECVDAAIAFEVDEYSLSRGLPGWSAVLKDFRKATGAAAG